MDELFAIERNATDIKAINQSKEQKNIDLNLLVKVLLIYNRINFNTNWY